MRWLTKIQAITIVALTVIIPASGYASAPQRDAGDPPAPTPKLSENSSSDSNYDLHFQRAVGLSQKVQFAPGMSQIDKFNSFSKAMKEFDKAIKISPTPEALTEKADLLIWGGGYKEAKDLLFDVIKKHPGYAYAHLLLGEALRYSGDSAGAEEVQRKALAMDPGFPLNYSNLALTLYTQDRLDEAAQLYERTLIMTQHARKRKDKVARYEALVSLSTICQRKGDLERAGLLIEEAMQWDNRRPDAFAARGKLKMQQKDKTAIQDFEEALKRCPGDESYRKELEKAKAMFREK